MNRNRTPSGVPTGGQFAAGARDESNVSLASHAHTRGSRYDGSDVADIAKSMRSEIRTMQKAGDLPADWKVSVRIDRFAGGQAIDVRVSGVEWETYDHPTYGEVERPVAAHCLAAERVDQALQSYNYDNSDSMRDYFDVHFYGSVTLDGRTVGTRDRVCETCVQYFPCPC